MGAVRQRGVSCDADGSAVHLQGLASVAVLQRRELQPLFSNPGAPGSKTGWKACPSSWRSGSTPRNVLTCGEEGQGERGLSSGGPC